ncbi:hypothetical protein AB0M20_19280 [Actinoplanes sp. NPDC051633]|uniref:hypothetical protein n=1 Tax=Actinoplanes sp. NPDC051633 TaxID=3155670 RepID=UPI00341DCE5C
MLLEGPAIEPLLAQVREEYGSGVRIISADKVRSGGFGGFFAKQHYELSVEVPDSTNDRKTMPQRKAPTVPPPTPAREEPANTLEQLLERAESNDRIIPEDAFKRPAAQERPPARNAAPAPAIGQGFGPSFGNTDKSAGREAGVEDATEAATKQDLSDNAAAFAELMAGLDAANHIASAKQRPSPRPHAGDDKPDTPTVRPFRPAAASGSPINSGTLRPLPPVPSLAELMGGLGVSEPTSSTGPTSPAGPAGMPGPPPAPGRSAAEAYGLTPVKPPASPPVPAGPELRPAHTDPVVANLMSVGMPEALAAQITGGDTYAGVLTALASRPAAPAIPDAAGEILVLAGDLSHAVPIGKQLLEQAHLDPNHLLLAGGSAAGTGLHSSRVMHTPKEAAARSAKMQAASSAWVVVLDARVGDTDPIWVNDMCDAIGATAVWAVVDATRKTADTARHLRALGEVEALVVHSVDLTADPATVLGLDLPIFSLDGKPATPHAWAAMLCARIAADVTPQVAAPRRQVRSAR